VACFNGGSFILGGLVLEEQKYIDFGLSLVNGCHDTYISTATGIGPEVFRWVESSTSASDPNNPPPPSDQEAFYEKSGFYITNSNYFLRPEFLESLYYAYRATGNQTYQDWAWDAFLAINTTCAVGSGYAELKDVNAPGGGGFYDFMTSFFFAEVLKYSYLIQAPVSQSRLEVVKCKSAHFDSGQCVAG
jgi:mannosyl-oligosaccharide alpha-1,2-mannosidase